MELSTGILSPAEIQEEIVWIVDFLATKGFRYLQVMYGWACNLDIDELWKDIPITIEELGSFIQQSTERGIYNLGGSDLFIQVKDGTVKFLLCHESDINLETENSELLQEVKAHWAAQGYRGYEKLKGEWKSWSL